ncbi:dipeptide epimerase [Ahniella affigens]|uniref:Dipeptide epimerase n=1 Tax=Ahniella affigens TaxID=2021234 RepID=A0A2P1PSI4_9GAMM|nr:dipeptide epimerase [Ahniella affigens]AVP97790.1 dipeptide epimerase [Ahniella affigens]
MIITACHLTRIRAPLITPFKTALRTVQQVDDIAVILDTDVGIQGYGSAPATAAITGDTHGSIVAAITEHLAPRLIGRSIACLHELLQANDAAIAHNNNAKAAIDMALHDLWATFLAQPLCVALGGQPSVLETNLTISLNAPDAMLADAAAAVARGFRALKIKLGGDPASDLARVRHLHAHLDGQVELRLDANQAWNARQTVQILRALEQDGIQPAWIEQPVPAADIAGLRHIREHVATPVMVDESVFDLRQLLRVLELQAADLVNLKLMKAGGIRNTLMLADLCRQFGVPCQIGCMLESALGVSAAAHVAAARRDVIRFIDLDAAALCLEPGIVLDTRFEHALIHVNHTPGLGVRELLEP